MSFPQTRQTLIRRLTTQGAERDWHQFMRDYWQPVCLFAQRRARLSTEDAEDVAARTFEAVLRNQLLQRWASDRSAKLRTLLCTVVRHVLGNDARVQAGRWRLLKQRAPELIGRDDLPSIKALDAPTKQVDAFDAAWAQGMLQQCIEGLMQEYHRTGKGDYFRVLYGRICEQMTVPQIAEALGLTVTKAENYYKSTRKRLTAKLQELLRSQVERYCKPDDADEEFAQEWDRLGRFLARHGGLEQAVAAAYAGQDPALLAQRQRRAMTAALNRITRPLPQTE